MTSAVSDRTSLHFSAESSPAEMRPTPCNKLGRLIAHEQTCGGEECAKRVLTPLSDSPSQMAVTVRALTRQTPQSRFPTGVQCLSVSGGLCARRTRELLSDGDDNVVLQIQVIGRCAVSQLGREVTVAQGDGLLTSNADASTISLPEATHFASVGLSRRMMLALVPRLEDAFARPIPSDAGILRLLVRYLDILDDESALRTPELRHAVVTHIQDLCALAIGTTPDTATIAKDRGLRAARLRAIKVDIAQHLSAADVSAAAVARRQGVSPRYVRQLFASEGTTLSRYVLTRRLLRVHGTLTDPRSAHLAISTIAYNMGVGDISTFNREFRRLFGATPTDIRSAALK
jgi:AraC-like DNA-binding protein